MTKTRIDNNVNHGYKNTPNEVSRLSSNNPILENNKEITEETMQSLIDRCTALTEKTMQYFADSKYENK